MRWLIPRLSAFQDLHSNVELNLSVGGGALDAAHDRVALAIRRLDFLVGPNWTVTRLMEESVGPVMQPAMHDRFLAAEYVALGAKTRPDAWGTWATANPDAPTPRATRFLDHHFLVVEAAASGLGVAMCPKVLALDDICNKRLIAPLGFAPDGPNMVCYSRPGPETPELVMLKEWLIGLATVVSA